MLAEHGGGLRAVPDHPADEFITRQPPHAEDAEYIILGTMLKATDWSDDRDDIIAGLGDLGAKAFYRPVCATIYEAIVDLYKEGHPTTTLTVQHRLEHEGQLAKVGGVDFLFKLLHWGGVGAAAAAVEVVMAKAAARRVQNASLQLMTELYTPDAYATPEIIARGVERITEAADDSSLGGVDWRSMKDLVPSVLDQIQQAALDPMGIAGISTGWKSLDDKISGLVPGEMIVVAGTPSTGKTTFATSIIQHCSMRLGVPCAMFSLEMTAEALTKRIISSESGVGLKKLRSGQLSESEWKAVADVTLRIQNAPLHVWDVSSTGIDMLVSMMRTASRRMGIKVFVLDYLQIIPQDPAFRGAPEAADLANKVNRLRMATKDLGVTLILLSQLKRDEAQKSADWKPSMRDMKGSSAIEDSAHNIIMLHRPDIVDPTGPRAGEMDGHLVKARDGSPGVMTFSAQLHIGRISDMGMDKYPLTYGKYPQVTT